jgi:integrase
MNTVQPIRNKRDISRMKSALNGRDKLLFIIGINSALRISDLLTLKVGDIRGKNTLTVYESKTKKTKHFRLNSSVVRAISELIPKEAGDSDWLFPSRKRGQPISRVQAYRILNTAAQRVGIDYKFGTHSMRKTFGYFAHQQGVDLALIQTILNHASQRETLRYIGVEQDDIDDVYAAVSL